MPPFVVLLSVACVIELVGMIAYTAWLGGIF
jgi:hypothetical protein